MQSQSHEQHSDYRERGVFHFDPWLVFQSSLEKRLERPIWNQGTRGGPKPWLIHPFWILISPARSITMTPQLYQCPLSRKRWQSVNKKLPRTLLWVTQPVKVGESCEKMQQPHQVRRVNNLEISQIHGNLFPDFLTTKSWWEPGYLWDYEHRLCIWTPEESQRGCRIYCWIP